MTKTLVVGESSRVIAVFRNKQGQEVKLSQPPLWSSSSEAASVTPAPNQQADVGALAAGSGISIMARDPVSDYQVVTTLNIDPTESTIAGGEIDWLEASQGPVTSAATRSR